jgi:hypothetical protein
MLFGTLFFVQCSFKAYSFKQKSVSQYGVSTQKWFKIKRKNQAARLKILVRMFKFFFVTTTSGVNIVLCKVAVLLTWQNFRKSRCLFLKFIPYIYISSQNRTYIRVLSLNDFFVQLCILSQLSQNETAQLSIKN